MIQLKNFNCDALWGVDKIKVRLNTALAERLVWLKPSGKFLFSNHRHKGRCN
jgi:hypothetical protein